MAPGRRTYLDHNATSALRPQAAAAMARAFELPGNPSSVHAEGRAARAVVEAAREEVARLVGASPKGVIFTSGGTEANNTVLSPSFRRAGEPGSLRLIVGAVEHPSVLEGHRFPADAVERLPVDENGVIDLDRLQRALAEGGSAFVSIQAANNETGALQPAAEAAALVREHGGLIHSDAVQAAGRLPLDIGALGVDALTLSGHKFGGPKGAGALVLASDRLEIADRLLRGGGQERGRRAGTENVAAIAGFAAALAAARRDLEGGLAERLAALKSQGEDELRRIAPDAVIFAAGAARLPNTFAFAIPGLKAETALIAFDLAGVALSSGSACSSGKVRRSHVLQAMGVEPALAEGAIRVSLGWNSTEEDVFRFGKACETVVSSLYKRRANAA